MVGFFVGIIFFILTIPLRSAILILKTSIKTTEVVSFQRYKRRKKKQGEDVSIATDGIKKKKKIREGMTAPELALYHSQKLLLRALKTLLAVIQWIARLITCISVLVWIIVILFVVVMVACVGAIILVIIGGDFNWSGGTDSNGGNISGNEDCVDSTEAYMKACQAVWDNWRSKGIDYSWSSMVDPDYGNMRPDCSGYVYATLQEFGLLPKPNNGGIVFNTQGMGAVIMSTGKFDELDWTGQDALKAGDIVVQPESHTQVYMGNNLWLNNGDVGNIPNHDKPWNDGGYFAGQMSALGGKVYRLKATECETGDKDWDCPEGGLPIPLYLQVQYKTEIPGFGVTIAEEGCGYTSLAMVISYLKDEKIEPDDLIAKVGGKYHTSNMGISWSAFIDIPESYGITGVKKTNDVNEVIEALKQGHAVINSQGAGKFTTEGHIIVLRGITKEGKILVNDPYDNSDKNFAGQEFDMNTDINATSLSYWIFPKK